MLPIDVPMARNLLPEVEMHVGIPTPFGDYEYTSNNWLTFFNGIYSMFWICEGEGAGNRSKRLYLFGYYRSFETTVFYDFDFVKIYADGVLASTPGEFYSPSA